MGFCMVCHLHYTVFSNQLWIEDNILYHCINNKFIDFIINFKNIWSITVLETILLRFTFHEYILLKITYCKINKRRKAILNQSSRYANNVITWITHKWIGATNSKTVLGSVFIRIMLCERIDYNRLSNWQCQLLQL